MPQARDGKKFALAPGQSKDKVCGSQRVVEFQAAGGAEYPHEGPFLSQEIYQGSAATGTKLRSVWVDYESDHGLDREL